MTPRPILEIGEQLGLREDELIPYGRHKAKVALKGRARLSDRPRGRYVLVTTVHV
ncbi:MAG: formate--tetrahydrofolate ligase, partial [Gammaproteobacteria bacterium]